MPLYKVELIRSARKEFEGLPLEIRSKIVDALFLLARNPHSDLLQIKKMRDKHDLYRVRIGDYRVVYEIRKQHLVVLVIKIGHRSDVYRR